MAEKNMLDTRALADLFGDDTQKFAKEQEFGRRIYITAWAVEILAASLGLCIAFFQAYDGYVSSTDGGFSATINAILGALPFVLIAVIEPTKIPLAGGLYRVRHAGWKFLIFIALIGLTFVTFETIFAGLERQVTNVTAIVTEGKDDVRSLEEDIKNLSDEKVRIESLSIEEETKGLEDQILKLKESRQGENENEQKGLQDQSERIELEIAKLEERKSDILKPFNDKIADFERQETQSLNTIDTLNNQLNNLSPQNDNENNERRKSIKSIEDGINRAKNLYSSGEVAQIRKLQAILNVAEDGKKGKNTERVFEKWLIQEEEKISRYREEINAINEKTNADLATKEAEIKLEIVKEKEKAAKANTEKLKLIEQKAQEPQIENLNILISEKQDLITQLNKDSKVKEDANRLAFNKKIADLETRKSEITQKIDREKNAVLGEGGIDEKIKRFRKKITDTNNTLRREAEKNQVYRFAKKWFGKDDILEVKEKELAFISAIWFGSIALICATVGTILALISNIMRDPEAFKEKQKMRRATPVRRSIRLMMLALRRRLNKPKIVEKHIEVEKIVEVEKEVEKEVEIIKEVIKEVPVDRIVEVEKEVPVEKIAIKEVPVEIVRKELVHVPFYSTESGYVDATSALKNSEIPIRSVEEKNLVQQEVFDAEGKEIPNFEGMTKTKIIEWAKANKLSINGRNTKAELIKNIKSQLQ